MENLYSEHVRSTTEKAREILSKNKTDSVIVHSGSINFYHADDQAPAYRTIPHFARFAPAPAPNHLILISTSTSKPVYIETVPDDFWSDYMDPTDGFWKVEFSMHTAKTHEDAWNVALKIAHGKISFIGDRESSLQAKAKDIEEVHINPKEIINALNEERAVKTEYEIDCITKANKLASVGHTAMRDAFMNGASELDMHYAFLKATKTIEENLPYPTIIGLNEKSSVLHYQKKRASVLNGQSVLVDAGMNHYGYASDISRTYVTGSTGIFSHLLTDIEILQKRLCTIVKPGVNFIELHHEAHLGIANILKKWSIATVDGEDSIRLGITRAFFPHGLGHMLGIQVHDVGGSSDEGFEHPLRKLYPKIRTNKTLQTGNVTTIEPGLYFIPLLLKELRNTSAGNTLNWKLIDELTPFGGIRIEDNLVVTREGAKNLTRKYLPN